MKVGNGIADLTIGNYRGSLGSTPLRPYLFNLGHVWRCPLRYHKEGFIVNPCPCQELYLGFFGGLPVRLRERL